MEPKSLKHPEAKLHTITRDEGDADMKPIQQHNMGQHTNTLKHKENSHPDGAGRTIDENVPDETKLQPSADAATSAATHNIQTIFDPEIVARMKKIIASYTENHEELESITSETNINFIERLNIDSVDVVEIIIDTEQEFGITIEDEEIKQLKTFELLYKLVESKIRAARAADE